MKVTFTWYDLAGGPSEQSRLGVRNDQTGMQVVAEYDETKTTKEAVKEQLLYQLMREMVNTDDQGYYFKDIVSSDSTTMYLIGGLSVACEWLVWGANEYPGTTWAVGYESISRFKFEAMPMLLEKLNVYGNQDAERTPRSFKLKNGSSIKFFDLSFWSGDPIYGRLCGHHFAGAVALDVGNDGVEQLERRLIRGDYYKEIKPKVVRV